MSDDFYQVGIYLKDELIGFANEVERENDKIELGYATEMLDGMLEELFQSCFSEVIAGAFEENTASIRVMEKCNMEKLDKVDEIEYRDVVHTCVYYSKKLH